MTSFKGSLLKKHPLCRGWRLSLLEINSMIAPRANDQKIFHNPIKKKKKKKKMIKKDCNLSIILKVFQLAENKQNPYTIHRNLACRFYTLSWRVCKSLIFPQFLYDTGADNTIFMSHGNLWFRFPPLDKRNESTIFELTVQATLLIVCFTLFFITFW